MTVDTVVDDDISGIVLDDELIRLSRSTTLRVRFLTFECG